MFNKKKQYFKKMQDDIQRVIWNQEFKRFKALAVREQLRREYDQAADAFTRINAQPDNEQAQKDKPVVEQKITQLKGQIDDMEVRLNGVLPTETSEGLIGITQELESSIELREYIKAFVKHNV
jgi:hypothetical protein